MRTVFHLMDGDPDAQENGLTIVQNLTEDGTVDLDDIAVVVQAEAIEAVTPGGSTDDLVESLLDAGVSFRACGNTLDMFDLTDDDLIDGVETVSSGAGELTRLGNDGYAYIKL